jgi:hypothetical protein
MKGNKNNKIIIPTKQTFEHVTLNPILPYIKNVVKLHKQNNHIRRTATWPNAPA